MAFNVTAKLSEDRKEIQLEFEGPVAMNTDGLAELMYSLGKLRGQMQPPVPDERPVGVVNASLDPRYHIQPDQMYGGTVLAIRHHLFGWLHFSIPVAEVEKMRGYLEVYQQPVDDSSASKQ